jgi:hypothetical protein
MTDAEMREAVETVVNEMTSAWHRRCVELYLPIAACEASVDINIATGRPKITVTLFLDLEKPTG